MKNEDVFIDEEAYQNVKEKIGKSDDYFVRDELLILMQFLMQRQGKVIRNEVKRDKID